MKTGVLMMEKAWSYHCLLFCWP